MSDRNPVSVVEADAQEILDFMRRFLAKPEISRSTAAGNIIQLGFELLCMGALLNLRRAGSACALLIANGTIVEADAGYFSLSSLGESLS